jgi:hypothetical protein
MMSGSWIAAASRPAGRFRRASETPVNMIFEVLA